MNLFTNLFTMTWQQSWELLAWTMCYFLAAGTVVALAGALLRFLCKRLPPQIRYAVSLAIFATLAALPFGIALGLSQMQDLARISVVADVANSRGSSLPATTFIELKGTGPEKFPEQQFTPKAEAMYLAPVVPAPAPEIFVRTIEFLPWVWLIGTPLTFLLLATGLIGSNRLRQQCTLLTEGPVFEACERLRTTLAVSQRVGIAINERIATPLLIGIVRPLILLPPAALTGWSPDELEMVLLHELAHVRRWDNLVNFGQRLVESLLFFHPAVWWVSRCVRRDREECCDAVVVARTEKPQAYAELLVTLATPTSPLASLAMAQHPLAGRIRRILHLEEEKMLITRSTLGLVGLFFAALLGIVLWQPATPTIAQETNTPVALGLSEDKATEDTESTEETENVVKKEGMQRIPFVVNIPEKLLDESNYRPWMGILAKQGFKSTINIADTEDGKYVKHELIIEVPMGSNPRVVWEEHSDGMRPRVILSNSPSASNKYPATHSQSRAYQQTNRVAPASNQPSPFPTLEAQRSADLAYKLLGIELGQLDKEELARVKAMKFAGGLLVTAGEHDIATGDLLVGLHVWPTTSLDDIKKVLDRDDLQDLSPLKFYVIRKVLKNNGGYGGEFGEGFGEKPETGDQLVTGRIKVNIAAIKKKAVGNTILPPAPTSPPKPHALAPGDSVKVIAIGVYPDQPIADVYRIEEMGTLAFGPTYGRIKVAGLTLLEAEAKVLGKLQSVLNDTLKEEVRVQITLEGKAFSK